MKGDNLSAVLYGIDDIRLEQREIPTPADNQLLIRDSYFSGIPLPHIRPKNIPQKKSNVHYWKNGAIGKFIVNEPMILGHETSGTVAGLGSDVVGFQVGDRVAIEPGVPCRTCIYCKFFATPPTDGSLTRFVVFDADFCYKTLFHSKKLSSNLPFRIPDCVTFEEAALLEPLSVAVHSCRRAMGAKQVVITDLYQQRLELAKKLGAEHIINVHDKNSSEVRDQVVNALGSEPDVTIECTGAQASMESAILATRPGGVIVMVGLGAPRVDLPIIDAAIKEVDIRGVFRYANCYPTALNLVASGRVDLSGLTRARYRLEDAVEAFKRAQEADVIKVFIRCDDSQS
ncbi:unnamed protein product [Nippostrongylus brasiliensis]|uniref:Sorbitol dehydrogenase n=1 Tax=Nippostrongylus brasiliensis TaxID=27835 RepID=A0A0N4XWI4_NIPBR|nr:unnamed protein product [Nippostrongylus brasiliensis]